MIQSAVTLLFPPAIAALFLWGGISRGISPRDRSIALVLAAWGCYACLHSWGVI